MGVDRLDQLFARSKRDIEAHSPGLSGTETGSYFLDESSHLLAALRLWAQSRFRTDQVVRELLELADVVALNTIARQLEELGTPEGHTASRSVALIAGRPSGELMATAGYALRAL